MKTFINKSSLVLCVFPALGFSVAAFIKMGLGRLYERKSVMELIVLSWKMQLIQCREKFNPEITSTKIFFTLLHGLNV